MNCNIKAIIICNLIRMIMQFMLIAMVIYNFIIYNLMYMHSYRVRQKCCNKT